MGVSVKLHLENKDKIASRFCKNDNIGLFTAETCARYMDKFIPMDSGMLAQNYTTKPYEVSYNSVYAHKIFFGEGFNFSKEKHPLATARWDRACSSANINAIAKEVSEYIKRL